MKDGGIKGNKRWRYKEEQGMKDGGIKNTMKGGGNERWRYRKVEVYRDIQIKGSMLTLLLDCTDKTLLDVKHRGFSTRFLQPPATRSSCSKTSVISSFSEMEQLRTFIYHLRLKDLQRLKSCS